MRKVILTILLLTFPLVCCAQNSIPLKNGNFFKYKLLVMDNEQEYFEIYNIEKIGNEEYKVIWNEEDYSKDKPLRPLAEFIINKNGKIIKVTSYEIYFSDFPKNYLGRQITFWLPYDKRKIGATIPFAGFEKEMVIISEKKWKIWDVWVTEYKNITDMSGDKVKEQTEMYFDKKTGFRVGAEFLHLRGFSYILKDTNVDIIH